MKKIISPLIWSFMTVFWVALIVIGLVKGSLTGIRAALFIGLLLTTALNALLEWRRYSLEKMLAERGEYAEASEDEDE